MERQLYKRIGIALRFGKAMLEFRALLFSGLLAIAVTALATVAEPRVLGYVIDEALIARDREALAKYVLIIAVLEVLRLIATAGHRYLFTVIGQQVMQDLRTRLFKHILNLPVAHFDKEMTGKLLTRVTNDIHAIGEMFTAGFMTIIENIITVIAVVLCLLLLNWQLGLIALIPFPILFVSAFLFSVLTHRAFLKEREVLSDLNTIVSEQIAGMDVVRLFIAQKLQVARFKRMNQCYAEAQLVPKVLRAYLHPIVTLTIGISVAFLLYYGSAMVVAKTLSIGVLVTAISYVLWVFWPVMHIVEKWNIFLSGMAALERVYESLDWEVEGAKPAATDSVDATGRMRSIIFENVWFAYQNEEWVLKDFSLEIKAGEKLGVVGPTGSGKSTLIALIFRFYSPQRGRILIDGKDIQHMPLDYLRSLLGIVQQDVQLFSGTVIENITLWDDDSEKIARVDKLFRDVVGQELPAPDRRVGEAGDMLSAGQRQLVSFARTVYEDPDIWILDEATASIDPVMEGRMTEMLMKVAQGRTIITIAHRMATIMDADRIIVLNKGCLLEQGSHAELLSKHGFYSRLWELVGEAGL